MDLPIFEMQPGDYIYTNDYIKEQTKLEWFTWFLANIVACMKLSL